MDEVCKICLKKVSQHEEVKSILKDLLDALLISLDTTGSQESIVCEECVSQIYELFDFKTLCLYNDDALFPFIEENAGKGTQLNLRSVFSKSKLHQFSESKEQAVICRLCLEITTKWVSLDTAISQTSVRDVLEKNIPEISLQAIERPCICENCLKMLDKLHSFASHCKSSAEISRLENQVDNQVQEFLAGEVENQFEDEFDNDFKIEIHEHEIDCVEDDIKGSVERIQNSDRYIKEKQNSDLPSKTKESDQGSTTSQITQRSLENPKKPNTCSNSIGAHEEKEIEVQCDSDGEVNLYLIEEHCEEMLTSNETKKSNTNNRPGCKTHYCAVCGQAFDTEPIMMEHIESEHGRNICSYCGRKFPGKLRLKEHLLRTHSGEKLHFCSLCGKGFPRKENLNSHFLIHMGGKPHVCPYCGKAFSMKASLRYHLRHHTVKEEEKYICTYCGKKFLHKTSLKKHIHVHHKGEERQTVKEPYICAHCGGRFFLKSILIRHIFTHTENKPHVCTHCGRGFSQPGNLNRHLLTHTGEKPHICMHCGKGFSIKNNLIRHVRTHTGEKPYICKHCEKGFAEKDILKCHLLTHTEEKPHICSTCGKGFTRKENLNTHLLNHAGEKPHVCEQCGKGFSSKARLNNHIFSHSEDNICSHCGKKFSGKSNLERHLLIHTEKKPHVCSHCGRKFSRKEYLNSHLLVHTRGNH